MVGFEKHVKEQRVVMREVQEDVPRFDDGDKGCCLEVSVGTILMLQHNLVVNSSVIAAFVLLDQVHSFQVSETYQASACKGVCGSDPLALESSQDEGLAAILVV